MGPEQQRNFRLFIGSFTVLLGLAILTQNDWLTFFSVIAVFFIIGVGLKILAQDRRIGLRFLGATIAITCALMYVEHLVKPAEPMEHSSGGFREAYDRQGEDTYTCPHCKGMGVRYNEVTGDIRKCASCGGDGVVTKEQYDRMSK